MRAQRNLVRVTAVSIIIILISLVICESSHTSEFFTNLMLNLLSGLILALITSFILYQSEKLKLLTAYFDELGRLAKNLHKLRYCTDKEEYMYNIHIFSEIIQVIDNIERCYHNIGFSFYEHKQAKIISITVQLLKKSRGMLIFYINKRYEHINMNSYVELMNIFIRKLKNNMLTNYLLILAMNMFCIQTYYNEHIKPNFSLPPLIDKEAQFKLTNIVNEFSKEAESLFRDIQSKFSEGRHRYKVDLAQIDIWELSFLRKENYIFSVSWVGKDCIIEVDVDKIKCYLEYVDAYNKQVN